MITQDQADNKQRFVNASVTPFNTNMIPAFIFVLLYQQSIIFLKQAW